MEENEFIKFGKNAQDPSKRTSALKNNFEKGEKDPQFLKNLAQLTIDDTDFNYKVFKRYFEVQPNISKDNALLLFTSLNGYEDPRYALIQEKKLIF
ncbi:MULTISPECIES: hypothetical protein [Chryseobacterium]|uniref:Uncharacterized protein n=1 Tax=Chryseobacterium geocarposphaerae TaxID=1416776 RepID=A0ABU1LBH8_9FLAO|nr:MULTISPECIES: hypothetical protein [Chryseobacterium]MDR6404049.1 hypothetical protein [Chryseobacterium geocarposphaerae]MDR6698432.1 hypothetical protein [Chryseobacterium ginsenosidimutans]